MPSRLSCSQIGREHGGDNGVLVAGVGALEVAAALLEAEDEAVLLALSSSARIPPPMYLKPVRTLRIFTPYFAAILSAIGDETIERTEMGSAGSLPLAVSSPRM